MNLWTTLKQSKAERGSDRSAMRAAIQFLIARISVVVAGRGDCLSVCLFPPLCIRIGWITRPSTRHDSPDSIAPADRMCRTHLLAIRIGRPDADEKLRRFPASKCTAKHTGARAYTHIWVCLKKREILLIRNILVCLDLQRSIRCAFLV